jgi:hypothetical protein
VRVVLLVLVALLVLALPSASGAVVTSGPVTFESPTLIDTGQPFGEPDWLATLSCTTSSLCVGVAGGTIGSQLISSSAPTGSAASDWTVVPAQDLPGATDARRWTASIA